MPYRVTLIPGDGIGPEVTEATQRVLEATDIKFEWDVKTVGEKAQIQCGTPLPDDVLKSIKKNKVALKGPVTTPIGTGFRSVNVALRKSLDLYACLRPCKTYPGAPTPFNNVDIVVVRENTEDLYAGIEFARGTKDADKLIELINDSAGIKVKRDSGFSIKMISESGSRRIVKFAFEYARANNRKRVSAGHKANIMKFSDGLFLATAREVAKEYPDITTDYAHVDATTMWFVKNPEWFDVIVTDNMFGDIITDLGAMVQGGMGIAAGGNINPQGVSMFEPIGGSAPKYTGKNVINPLAAICAVGMMLENLGEAKAGRAVEDAVIKVVQTKLKSLAAGKMGYSTTEVGDLVVKNL